MKSVLLIIFLFFFFFQNDDLTIVDVPRSTVPIFRFYRTVFMDSNHFEFYGEKEYITLTSLPSTVFPWSILYCDGKFPHLRKQSLCKEGFYEKSYYNKRIQMFSGVKNSKHKRKYNDIKKENKGSVATTKLCINTKTKNKTTNGKKTSYIKDLRTELV